MFLPSEAGESAHPVVMISHELWQDRFGGDLGVLGQTIRLEGKSHAIIGVLPPGLEFPLARASSSGSGNIAGMNSFWLPMSQPEGSDRTSRDARMFCRWRV